MAAKTTKTAKKRNPADATLRNVKAASKRTTALDARLDKLEAGLALAQEHITLLAHAGLPEEQVAILELAIASWKAS